MVTASKSERGFEDGDDEDEEEFGMKEKPSHRETAAKTDGSNNTDNSKDQKPSTPRSKHSATEQRRRTKINDRFQILRDLIPHSDQKRDKASFLLEVIEYIQFLQEKVQKYESSCPGWNQANAKLLPWKNCQAPRASLVDHSHLIKEASPGFIFPADESMETQPSTPWLRSPVTDASVNTDKLSGHEELTVDEGTSLSNLYSKRLLTTLTQALQNSGVDLSQASVSVQINLRRLASRRSMCSNKEPGDPLSSNRAVGHSRVASSRDESKRASKRHKSDTS